MEILQFESKCFSQQLKKVREYRGFSTQSVIADKLGVSRQTYSLWELGKRYPSFEWIVKFCNLFNIAPMYFILPDANPVDYDLITSGNPFIENPGKK